MHYFSKISFLENLKISLNFPKIFLNFLIYVFFLINKAFFYFFSFFNIYFFRLLKFFYFFRLRIIYLFINLENLSFFKLFLNFINCIYFIFCFIFKNFYYILSIIEFLKDL